MSQPSIASTLGLLGRFALRCKSAQHALAWSSKSRPVHRDVSAAWPQCGMLLQRFSSLPPHTVLNMPALSPTMSQGNIAKWHVKEGDEVKPGTVLADVETDKATLAFENQDEGFVAKLLVADGARDIPVGNPVAVLVEDAKDVRAFASYAPGASAAAAPAAAASTPPPPPATAPAAAAGKSYPPHTRMTMPALSPTMERGNIVSWKVAAGDAIKPGDVLADIETDKATLALENVSDEGVIAKILVPSGSRDIAVGTPVAIVVDDAASVAAFADYAAGGEAASSSSSSTDAGAAAGPAAAAAASAAPRVVASDRLGPAVRMLLASAGLGPADVVPTGPNNIITKGDVLVAIAAGVKPGAAAAAAAAAAAPAAPPSPPRAASKPAAGAAPAAPAPAAPKPAAPPATPVAPVADAAGGAAGHVDTPNSQIRRIIAQRLLESKRNTPTLYFSADARLEGIADLRASLAAKGTKVSVNDCVMRAVALALRDVPAANVYWDDKASEAVPFGAVDVSFAVATERGLITPIVKAADGKGLLAVSKEVRALALKARENKLKPEEFMGGSFTVSNLGMFGLSYFSAIINPPQAGILAIGGGQERVVLRDGEPAAVSVMTVTLSADGRVYDGELAGAVLDAFKSHIEKPYELL